MTENIGDKIKYALKYPFDGEKSEYKALLVGGVFVFLSIFIIPVFAVFGYQIRVYEASLKEQPRPEFEGILSLISEGFMAALTLFPAFIIVGILISLPQIVELVGAPIPILVVELASFILAVISSFITPIFLALYVDTGSFGGTYDLSRLSDILTNRDYLIQFLIFSVLASVLQVVLLVPLLLFVTIPFVAMYTVMVTSAYLGDMFRPFLEETRVERAE